MTEEELRGLEPGTWLRMRYGFDWVTFYVLSNTKDFIRLGNPKWLVSSTITHKHSDKELQIYAPVVIGKTKKRWWWKWSLFRNTTCPYQLLKEEV